MPKRKPIPKYVRPPVAPPEATGGAGVKFENDIQALFVTLMASDGEFKVFPNFQIESLQFQVFSKGYCTDDVLVRFVNSDNEEKILLGQIKRKISFRRSCREFTDTVQAAWIDYQNGKLFRKGRDALALITGPLCAKDLDTLDWLFNQARSLSMMSFFEKMRFGKDVSKTHRAGFELICEILGVHNDGPVNEEHLYGFLRSFYVFQSDMWYEEGFVSTKSSLKCALGTQPGETSPATSWLKLFTRVATPFFVQNPRKQKRKRPFASLKSRRLFR